MKVCAVPGCPNLQAESKCIKHRREAEARRGTRQTRGYGARHDTIRAGIAERMAKGERFRCWRCGVTLDPNAWHLGHDDHDRSRYRGPECVPCNTATSGRR